MTLKTKNIKRIHINGGDGADKGTISFELFEPLKHKKVSSTWVPQLLGVSEYNTVGDKLLEFYGLLKGDEFNNYYSLRGAIAERIIVNSLKKKGYNVKVFKEGYDAFPFNENSDNKLNALYKYWGGLPDIVYEKEGQTILLEVKSKELDAKEKIETNPPHYEIMQGKILALLYGLDSVTMSYVMFSDKVSRNMYLSISEPFDLQKSVEDFDSKMPTLKYKEDFEIINKEYVINKPQLLLQMKEAYKYAETFRQTLTVKASDLSKPVYKMLFQLESELENDFKG